MATQQQQIDFEVTTDNHSPSPSSQEDAANMEGEDVDAIIAGNKKQLTADDNNADDTESEGTPPRENSQLTNAATAAPPPSKKSKKGTTTGSKKGTKCTNQAPSTTAENETDAGETHAGETDGPPETTLGNVVARLCILTFLLLYVVFPPFLVSSIHAYRSLSLY